jgi:hypothetical protein
LEMVQHISEPGSLLLEQQILHRNHGARPRTIEDVEVHPGDHPLIAEAHTGAVCCHTGVVEAYSDTVVVFWSHGGSPYIGGGSFRSAEALLGSLEALSAAAKAYSGAVEGHHGSGELVLVLDPWDAIFLHCVHRAVIEIP